MKRVFPALRGWGELSLCGGRRIEPGVERKAFVEQAKQCLRDGSVSVALEFARQAYQMDPTDEEVLCVLGAALSYAERDEEAEEVFSRAVSLYPRSAKAHYNLAVHYYRWGRKERAWELARKALSLAPLHSGVRNLLRLLEEEQKLPPVREEPHPPLGSSPPPVPPGGRSTERSPELQLPHSPHLFGFIEALGSKWDGILLTLFALSVVAWIWVVAERITGGLPLGTLPEEFSAIWMMAWLLWLGWAVTLVVDMLDRRPNAIAVFFGVGGLLAGVGWCCLPAMMIAVLCFGAYYLSSREKVRF